MDMTGHLNELNVKLTAQKDSICHLMKTVHSFQIKLDVFREDLQADCEHFPLISPHVGFTDERIGNFCQGFDCFKLGPQLLRLTENPFLIRGFSKEGTQTLDILDLLEICRQRRRFQTTDCYFLVPDCSLV